jgi:hypothetical protein
MGRVTTRGQSSAAAAVPPTSAPTAQLPAAEPKPPRKYEIDQTTDELTDAAYARFTADYTEYTKAKNAYDCSASTVFAIVLANCLQSTVTALDNSTEYASIRDACDCALLHHLLRDLFKQTTIVRSQAALRNLSSIKQGTTDTVTAYTKNTRQVMDDIRANYEDPAMPGYIKINTLHVSVFLAGLGPANQPMMDKLMLTNMSIHDLNLATIQSEARDYEANIASNKKQTGGGSDKQGGAGGKTSQGEHTKKGGAGGAATKKDALTPYSYIQALSVVAQHEKKHLEQQQQEELSRSVLPKRNPDLWSPTHPHCRPKGPGDAPPTDKAYCAHCHKNGWIIVDERHLGECSDHKRYLELPGSVTTPAVVTPKSLFTGGEIDFATLEVLATQAGLTPQYQR